MSFEPTAVPLPKGNWLDGTDRTFASNDNDSSPAANISLSPTRTADDDGTHLLSSPISSPHLNTSNATPSSSPTSSSSPFHSARPNDPSPPKAARDEGSFSPVVLKLDSSEKSPINSPVQKKTTNHSTPKQPMTRSSPLRTPPTGRRGDYRAAVAETSHMQRMGSPRSAGNKSSIGGNNPLLHPPLPNLDASNGTIISSGVCMTCGVDPKGTPDGVPAIPSVLATELVRLERENRSLRVSVAFLASPHFLSNLFITTSF